MDRETLYKFFEGAASYEEEVRIRQWMEHSPENRREFLKERKIFDSMLLLGDEKTIEEKMRHKSWSLSSLGTELIKIAVAVAVTLGLSLLYQFVSDKNGVVPMQSIYVPTGQRVNITLSDGTNVWLNARTKIVYPAVFDKSVRQVAVDGEAYFDVAKDKKRPFIVETGKCNMEVLGTKFNVEGYSDKDDFEVTLMEGSVRVASRIGLGDTLMLKPDSKACLQKDGRLKVIPVDDYNPYRWKEGLICFRNESFLSIMNDLEKYFGVSIVVENKNVTEPVDEDLKNFILQVPKNVSAKMDKLRVADAITEVFSLFKRCNKYIDETMPWALAKDETKQDRLATVLYNLVEGICIGASLLKSFMPRTTERILVQLNANERTLEEMDQFGLYPSGNRVTDKPEILFARLDLKEVLEKVEKLHPKKEEPKEEAEEAKTEDVIDIEAKPEITFDDFEKLQFQVGEIIACEEVKKSRKLLCSQVKIGSQVRQIVSGIKAHYSAEEMVGKKVMVVTNLKPAKLAGILSEGMILCAEDADGNLSLMVPEKEMPAGAEIC